MLKNCGLLTLALIAVVTCLSDRAAAQTFEQNRFVIGLWGDPPIDNLAKARYQDIADANFNIVMSGMGADTPLKATKQRDVCERLGLKILFDTYGLSVDELCNCKTTYGFLVKDHPRVSDFTAVRARVDELRAGRPEKLTFINLYPVTASPEEYGAESYESYLGQFIAAIEPEVLCFDLDPVFGPPKDDRAVWCGNLAEIRSRALDSGVPFWVFFRARARAGADEPTEAEIRWQVFTSIAYGAKGVLYDRYWTPPEEGASLGLVTASGEKTPRYAIATRVNAELQALGPILLASESSTVAHVDLTEENSRYAEGTFTLGLAQTAPIALTVGSLNAPSGQAAIMLSNYATDAGAAVSLEWTGGELQEISKTTGHLQPVADELPGVAGLQIRLGPGDGRLFMQAKQG